ADNPRAARHSSDVAHGMDIASESAPVPSTSITGDSQMANRNQGFSQSGSRRQSVQYGSWRDEDRDENNVESREQYGSRDTNEQSGSTGRYAGYGDFGRGEYGGGSSGWSGQERYGQSGYG